MPQPPTDSGSHIDSQIPLCSLHSSTSSSLLLLLLASLSQPAALQATPALQPLAAPPPSGAMPSALPSTPFIAPGQAVG